MEINKSEIAALDKKKRLHLINSITGIKPANLIGTKSINNVHNVAIFSSVVHLGSNPPQIGLIIRPQDNNPRDTYKNIIETKYYSINHISNSFIEKAHLTSAKLPIETSEFEHFEIEEEIINGFHAPFVKASPVKIGMKLIEKISLPNKCIFIIGSVEFIVVSDEMLNEHWQLNLSQGGIVGISGLNFYYDLKFKEAHDYVRLSNLKF